MKDYDKYLTIRQMAERGIITEFQLRKCSEWASCLASTAARPIKSTFPC